MTLELFTYVHSMEYLCILVETTRKVLQKTEECRDIKSGKKKSALPD